jgi:hypothetical protein
MNKVVGTAVVPVSTLDAEFDGKGTNLHRVYLKLDTQGFDLEVLRGGKRAISAIPALQTELSFRPFYNNMPDYKTAISAFESYGFAVADMFLVCIDDTRRAMEFDCIMVRDGSSRSDVLKQPGAKISVLDTY